MIRGWLCLAVIIVFSAFATPALSNTFPTKSTARPSVTQLAAPDPTNSTAAGGAFNYTLSSANIFSNATAKVFPALNLTQFKWFSTANDTTTGSPIMGTAFNYTVNPTPSSPSSSVQQVAWNITVPKSNCTTCSTLISFSLFGNLTKGTSENFTLAKAGALIKSGVFQGNDTTERPICSLASGGNATVCGPTVKLPVDSYVASTLTLTFRVGWNITGASLKASVGEVIVESLDNTIKSSVNSVMTQTPGNTVTHYATFAPVSYNTTNSVTPWTSEVLNVYYPFGYNLTGLQLNQTSGQPVSIFPFPTTFSRAPFQRTLCNDGVRCAQSLIAINMSDIHPTLLRSSKIYISALTTNTVVEMSTLSGGVATRFFTSGDEIGIKVVNSPSITNAPSALQTGTLTIAFASQLSIQPGIQSTAEGGVFNFTLPTSCGTLGQLCARDWNVSATFKSLYDMGNATTSFRIDLLQVKSFTGVGGDNSLSIQGAIEYGNGTTASGINTTLFAVDRGTPINTPIPAVEQTNPSSSRPYIANVTFVNGVFTQGQPLIMLLTVVNPNATQQFNATLVIEHEWPGPQPHNMSTTFLLKPGDQLNDLPLNSTRPQTYEADITFAATGVQVTLKNLRTVPNFQTRTMSTGTSPVLPNRPHAGLFNITLTSNINNVTQYPASKILSPTYAYIAPSLLPEIPVPSRFLYESPSFKTDSTGGFSQTISPPHYLLGARNLTVFVLARDASGIVVVNNLPKTGFSDSTILTSSVDAIGPTEKSGSSTATIHLKNNSTEANGITQVISVVLVLQGDGPTRQVATQTDIRIAPGSSVTVSLTFTAPASVGSYTLTFSSPEYGGVLASQTLQVTILSGNLQLLIPAGIGVAAAIIVLGFLLVRGKRGEQEDEAEAKPKGPSPKQKPATAGTAPAKSLTRTDVSKN